MLLLSSISSLAVATCYHIIIIIIIIIITMNYAFFKNICGQLFNAFLKSYFWCEQQDMLLQ